MDTLSLSHGILRMHISYNARLMLFIVLPEVNKLRLRLRLRLRQNRSKLRLRLRPSGSGAQHYSGLKLIFHLATLFARTEKSRNVPTCLWQNCWPIFNLSCCQILVFPSHHTKIVAKWKFLELIDKSIKCISKFPFWKFEGNFRF